MKKILISLFFVVLSSALHAQFGKTYTQEFDSLFINVQKTDAETGILYDRVVSFAGLQRPAIPDTLNATAFIQAYSELYRAAFLPAARLPYSVEDLEKQAQSAHNVVNVGLLHYRFNVIDSAVAARKLYFNRDSVLLEDRTITASLYKEHTVFVAAPLVNVFSDSIVTFRFSNQLQFENTTDPIVQLEPVLKSRLTKFCHLLKNSIELGSAVCECRNGHIKAVFATQKAQKTIKNTNRLPLSQLCEQFGHISPFKEVFQIVSR